jgi:protein MpaA
VRPVLGGSARAALHTALRATLLATASAVLLTIDGSCELPADRPARQRETTGPRAETIGRSVEGIAIEAWVFPGSGSRAAELPVLILGGIHGDEPASSELVQALREHLDAHPGERAGREVIIVPRVNPDGLRRFTRANARGIDLNRNFPARNFRAGGGGGDRALSEPESRAVAHAIRLHAPSLIVAVHCPLGCVDPDGGGESVAVASLLSRSGGLPVKDLEELPGSLGTYASRELGKLMVTYELERRSGIPRASMARHVRALATGVRYTAKA